MSCCLSDLKLELLSLAWWKIDCLKSDCFFMKNSYFSSALNSSVLEIVKHNSLISQDFFIQEKLNFIMARRNNLKFLAFTLLFSLPFKVLQMSKSSCLSFWISWVLFESGKCIKPSLDKMSTALFVIENPSVFFVYLI